MSDNYLDEDGEEQFYAIRPNKTEIKRDIAVILKMAEAMTTLSLPQLKEFDLPDNVFKAIAMMTKMPHKAARKREMKYVAAQFRKIELEPIQEKLARLQSSSVHAVREHHQAEQWRDKLISGDNSILTQFLTQYPSADSQQLRQLQRNAKKELAAEKPPKTARALYKYIKVLLQMG
ncbi:MAG: ribosome biogenesis factor YjgA [Methylococcales bacterium]|nr:ribosome biogenesis factor YjgA [Methylococcales bacterium]